MKPLLLLCLLAVSGFAQHFRVGIKGGVPLTDFYSTVSSSNFGFNSNTKRYVVGPSVELQLPFGLGVEFDALYRRVNYGGSALATGTSTIVNATANAWEFPLLAKYRFAMPVAQPFVDAGIAWDRLGGLSQSVRNALGLRTNDVSGSTTKGFVMGAGLEIKAPRVHIVPEVRYTRWGSSKFVDPLSLVRNNRNQAEVLLGITF
jgi:opacity protein-like surface antigen